MKLVIRNISLILCLAIIFYMAVLCGCKKKEEEQVAENGMNAIQNMYYALGYKLGCNQDTVYHIDVTKELEFYATEDTEKVIAVWNYMIWDHKHTLEEMARVDEFRQNYGTAGRRSIDENLKSLNGLQERARALCEEYGITNDNRLTVEWVMENPEEAVFLYTDLPGAMKSTINSMYRSMYEKYNLGGEESDPQPNTGE